MSRGCPITTEATPAPRPARKSRVAGEKTRVEEVEVDDEDDDDAPSPSLIFRPRFLLSPRLLAGPFDIASSQRGDTCLLCSLPARRAHESAQGRNGSDEKSWSDGEEKKVMLFHSTSKKTLRLLSSLFRLFSFLFFLQNPPMGKGGYSVFTRSRRRNEQVQNGGLSAGKTKTKQ